jgi:hypothetical protein
VPEQPTFAELRGRIQRDIDHFGGQLPERLALVWDGYIAGLLEWGLVSVADHARLSELLLKLPDNPVISVFLGRPEASEEV